MKVVGLAVAYSIVPSLEVDETADGHVMVDSATEAHEIDDEPGNGSLRPH